jgi:hypothetical protein
LQGDFDDPLNGGYWAAAAADRIQAVAFSSGGLRSMTKLAPRLIALSTTLLLVALALGSVRPWYGWRW